MPSYAEAQQLLSYAEAQRLEQKNELKRNSLNKRISGVPEISGTPLIYKVISAFGTDQRS